MASSSATAVVSAASAAAINAMDHEIVVPSHPYYPIDVKLVGYIPNEYGVLQLVSMFGAGCAAILAITLCLIQLVAPKIKVADKICVLWFVLTASIHLWFEGYFAYNHYRMPTMTDLFGQLWKEYSQADSRYLTSDPFVLCMETITALFWGILSYFQVSLILKQSPYRHPLQIIICGGQVYGDILYYMTSWFNKHFFDLDYCRPEAYYYWFYYFFMNFIWIIIPGYYLQDSFKKIAHTFTRLQKLETASKKR